MKRKVELLLDALASNMISWSFGFIILVAFVMFFTAVFQDSIILGVFVALLFIYSWMKDFLLALESDNKKEKKGGGKNENYN